MRIRGLARNVANELPMMGCALFARRHPESGMTLSFDRSPAVRDLVRPSRRRARRVARDPHRNGFRHAAFAALLSAAPATAQCAVLVDLRPGPQGGFPQGFTAAFERDLYFTWGSPTIGAELWKWSASGGAVLVKDINPNGHGSPAHLTPCCTAFGPRVFFSAFSPGAGTELWVTDGTSAGTFMVKDIDPGTSSSNPTEFFAADGRVFFSADDGMNGAELWTSDGTPSGTVMVADLNPGPSDSLPANLAATAGGRICFTAFTAAAGRELWVTDGTTSGTQLVVDFAPGAGSGGPLELASCGGHVFFSVGSTTFGHELWKSDGTAAGTVMVKDIAPNSSSSSPINFCCCGGVMFFTATVSGTGRELYLTDGTAAGTVMVKDINPGSGSSGPTNLTCAGARVFFSATVSTATTGTEPWVSDGTAAGTFEVRDIFPGAQSSFPQLFVPSGTGVCFRATDASSAEIWFSDGTQGGTFQVCDVEPSGSSNPTQFVTCNGRVFFTANDPAAGNELFHIATPGAMTATLGSGGLPDRPWSSVRGGATPVLGTTIDVDVNGPAGHLGALFAGPAGYPIPPVPGLMQGGCDWVGALLGSATLLVVGPPPSFSVPIGVPSAPALEGAAIHFQAVWVSLGAPPLFQFSNGLQLVLGTAAPH